jgi:transketolase N-terminal domain/subunit
VSPVERLKTPYDRERLEDVGFLTCMTLVLLGNYAQTGHLGGPLAYTPYNVASHLAGPELGGLRFDYRRPKHPYSDKFMLAGGHCIPTCYALWMVMGQALARKYEATGNRRYHVDPAVAMLPIDALGFRRGAGALRTLLQDHGLADHPRFAQAKARGIRALSGHAESTDVTNDVNGGPSGIGIATAAGKAAFWDVVGAGIDAPKVIAFEGEFAMTEGHAQELKTQAIALQVGKRLRVILSDNNAGIDDALLGGVIDGKYDAYRLVDQWTSYGWNVFVVDDGNDYDQVVASLNTLEHWDPKDRRPMVVIAKTIKGYWPAAKSGKIDDCDQVVGYKSHPYGLKMNSDYFLPLACSFENWYGVKFEGIQQGPVKDPRERLLQFKTNIDVVMSLLDKNGLGDWLADRLVDIGDSVKDELPTRADVKHDPFLDERLRVANLPEEPQTLTVRNSVSGAEKQLKVALFRKAGEVAGTRRGISEIVKWLNYVTGNRMLSIAADLSESINLEHGSLWGHYDPEANPLGTRERFHGHRPRESERVARSRQVRRGVGDQRDVRGVHPLDVHTGPRVEPAEPGQQVPCGRPAHPGRAFRTGNGGGRSHPLRDLRAAGVEAVPARADHSPELLGLQRRGAGLFRGGRDRRARSQSGDHHAGGRAPGFPGGRPEHVRRHRRACGSQGLLRDSRLRAGPAAARLRGHAGLELHREPGERAAEARGSRDQREGCGCDQRRAVRPPAGGVPPIGAAAGGVLRPHGREHRHAPGVAAS